MNARQYKSVIVAQLCIIVVLVWCWWNAYRQIVWAGFISRQCIITQDAIEHPSNDSLTWLALRLDFLMGYYDYHSRSLADSRLQETVRQQYEQTLTNAVAYFRSHSKNDLGSDPKAWIRRYEP
jgi:hypothetical protein